MNNIPNHCIAPTFYDLPLARNRTVEFGFTESHTRFLKVRAHPHVKKDISEVKRLIQDATLHFILFLWAKHPSNKVIIALI